MSVLIKGMEMPKSCDVCCFDLFVESCPLYNATPEDLVGITWIKKARHRYCPLVELPPHGRLIDADALMKVLSKVIDINASIEQRNEATDQERRCLWWFEQQIGIAPTIIEAEEGE